MLASGTRVCYRPECRRPLVVTRGSDQVADFEIAHIRDEFPPRDPTADIGWRYWPEDLTQEDRNRFDNLILLCPPCHKLIDRIRTRDFSPELLHGVEAGRRERCLGRSPERGSRYRRSDGCVGRCAWGAPACRTLRACSRQPRWPLLRVEVGDAHRPYRRAAGALGLLAQRSGVLLVGDRLERRELARADSRWRAALVSPRIGMSASSATPTKRRCLSSFRIGRRCWSLTTQRLARTGWGDS